MATTQQQHARRRQTHTLALRWEFPRVPPLCLSFSSSCFLSSSMSFLSLAFSTISFFSSLTLAWTTAAGKKAALPLSTETLASLRSEANARLTTVRNHAAIIAIFLKARPGPLPLSPLWVQGRVSRGMEFYPIYHFHMISENYIPVC